MHNLKRPLKLLILLIIITVFCVSVAGTSNIAYADEISVYLGGNPIGVIINSQGVMITEITNVVTKEGMARPSEEGGLVKGDIITEIDGKLINSPEDIAKAVKDNPKSVIIKVKRGNDILNMTVCPKMDLVSNSPKLGLHVKNEIAGVGTLTYVRVDNKRFGGLGHQICDADTVDKDIYNTGKIYNANIVGHLKGEPGKAGELRGSFIKGNNTVGNLDKNNFAGIFGEAGEDLYNKRPLIAVGSKDGIRVGKAYIYTTIEGNEPQKYEIEIVKTIKQNQPSEKSMIIKVTDPVLLEKTGGIVQGMSGSPIIQNGKLVGAVTHVFVNDPTRGYGIYIDWMLTN